MRLLRLYRDDLLYLVLAAIVFCGSVWLSGGFAGLTQTLYSFVDFMAAETPHV